MAAPSRVGRVFEPASRVGTALYLMARYVLLAMVLRRRGPANPAAEKAADVNEMLAVQALRLEDFPPPPEIDERFEYASHEEPAQIVEVAGIIAAGVVRRHAEARESNSAAMAMRSQHAKHHGCVAATFVVEDDLPDGLDVGVFRPGARYDAILRYSNAAPRRQYDGKGDGRGVAIKLKLDGRAQDGISEQDFLLTDHPVFFLDGIDDYAAFMRIAHATSPKLVQMLRFIWFFAIRFRKFLIFLHIARNKINNPLASEYFSMSVYMLGDDRIVRYRVTPSGRTGRQPAAQDDNGHGRTPAGPDLLREAMAVQLSPDKPGGGDGVAAAFDFSVQIRGRPRPADAENVSRAWRRSDDHIVRLARIEVKAQDFATDSRLYDCENLVFSPWNSLPQHRPIGSINRVRLAAYLASARLRGRLNMKAQDTPAPVIGRSTGTRAAR